MNSGFEQYNATKFDQLTAALKSALHQIHADPRLPLTVKQVADMADCSRQLLYSPKRKWVVKRIERIALSRGLRDKKESETTNPNVAEDDSAVQEILERMRYENAQLFHEKLALKQQLEALRDENEQLSRDLKACEEKLYELREEVTKAATSSFVRRRG